MSRATGQETTSARESAGQPAKPVPPIVRRVTSEFGWRHVKGIAVIRFLVAIWLVCLGSIALAFGAWWGAFIYLGAALVGWVSYMMPRWKLRLDAERSTPAPPGLPG